MNDFPKQLGWYAAVLFSIALLAASALLLTEGPPPFGVLLILAAITWYSFAYRDVKLPNGSTVSPGVMSMMAAIVVFREYGSMAAPVIVAIFAAADPSGLHRRCWGWLPFNAGVTGVGMLVAALTYSAMPDGGGIAVGVVAATVSVVAYNTVASALIATSYAIEDRQIPRAMLREFIPLSLQSWPFGLLGFFVGRMYLELGAGVLLLIIVPIFIAREMFGSYMKVKESHDETVKMLVHALEAKDRYTSGHSERVATYAQYMGEVLNFGPGRMERLRFAALMHDIGKLVVPNHLLNKPGKLTEEEYSRIRIHEKVSVQMLSHIDFLRPIAAASHSDHTRFDPDDPDHPIEPYMVMIADAYDAMTSTRSYRKALPQEVAFAELRDKAGIQFHPECVEALIGALEQRGEKHGAGFEVQDEFHDAPDVGVGSAGLGDLLVNEA